MRLGKRLLIPGLALLVGWFTWHSTQTEERVDFNAEIRSIFNTKCISCHGGVKESAGFSLFSRADALRKTKSGKPAIIPGNADASELLKRLLSHDEEERMPYHAAPLSSPEIVKIKKWVNQGASWADHWAYIKPRKPNLPAATNWSNHPVDRFIQARWQADTLQPAAPADKPTLLRRLSLDLIGLPPTLPEMQAFLADKSPRAYEKQVDRLLASPHFGERWAAMWLDLARYSDTKGYEKDEYRQIWRYRDYVIRSFNQDKPFSQFTTEQLAGDLLPNPTEEQIIATAYHRNTANNDEGGTDDEEFRTTAILDRVSNTWEVWQGTTMGCVQCHSHPYDPIRHREFYESMAFFNNTRDEDVPGEYPNLNKYTPTEESQIADLKAWLQQQLPVPEATAGEKQLDNLLRFTEPKIHPHSFSQLTNAALADGKYLGGGHLGFARLQKVDLTDKANLLLSVRSSQNQGTLEIRQDKLDGDLLGIYQNTKTGRGGINIRKLVKLKPTRGVHDLYFVFKNATQANPQDYVCQLEWVLFSEALPGSNQPGYPETEQTILALLNTPTEQIPVMCENPEGLRRKNNVFVRGNWLTKGPEVQPTTPRFLPNFKNYPKNRLGLAQWLVSQNNPLTARVTVNRFWEQLFGVGLVESLEDFGSQGSKPSHPELLDWLALNFQQKQNWQVKKLLRLLVLSKTYQQSSRVTPELLFKDPANRLLARGPRVRLTAEQIRDQALTTAGLLSRKMYGQSVMPPQPKGVWQVVYSGLQWNTSSGEDAYRRALYTFWRRSSPYPSLLTFDAAGREVCVSRRIRTNTPLQALVTLNDTVYLTAAKGLAQHMQQASKQPEAQIKAGYYRALFKYPNAQTLQVLTRLYRQTEQHYAKQPQELIKFLPEPAKNLKNSPQFAALTIVGNAILNLDEFITKE
ncbi:DUF1553 domain-containing protein [Adhaeribacter pallidiroseus]|uniref:Cytochrome c domain-containing protein n=1 Tax=Adhaeribacter pallidiroseus TaxID=2072847 RepID=A0A369QEA9_9BACT|nr:DUF1553 domain-containing protein [Adhaeribacter pallidiroseus]RDC62762.1 hypothetical protein AHMF7616_01356 [Adhaeribacter pallidiroseus]